MRAVLQRRWHHFRQYRVFLGWVPPSLLVAVIALEVVAGLATPTAMLGMGLAVDGARHGGQGLGVALVLCAVGLVAQQVLAPAQLWAAAEVAARVDSRVSARLIGACEDASLRALEQAEVGTARADVVEALGNRWGTPGDATGGALALVARYVGLAGAVALLTWVAGPIVGLLGLVIALVNRLGQTFGLSIWSRVNRRQARNRRRMAYVRGLATGPLVAREVRKLRLHEWLARRYRLETRRYLAPIWYARRRVLGWRFLWYSLISVVLAGVLLWVGAAHLSGHSPVEAGRVAILIQAATLCALFGAFFPESDTKMLYGIGPWDSLTSLETAVGVGPGPQAARVSASSEESRAVGTARGPADVRVEGLGFGYSPGVPVLRGIDLDLAAGGSMAIVGVNGAGKSTLVKLLAGFYQPDAGRVLVDGAPLSTAAGREWQREIAILFQDYLTYHLSLRENVVMQSRAGDADDALVSECLEQVGLGDQVRRFSRGLDTPLSRLAPGGTDLSGGQWQRLALARALYAVRTGARLLVMDEPTSQMDARGEAEFYQQFWDLTGGVTSLVISHRFSSVRRADRIAVLDAGVLTEQGSHDELVAAGGTYAQMFTVQAARYGL